MKSLTRVRLLATTWTAAYQAPPFMGFSRQEYWSGVLPGASTGVPTHDKVMRENPDRQGKSGLEDHPPPRICLSIYPKTRICLFYYFTTFTNSSDINRGLSPTTFL